MELKDIEKLQNTIKKEISIAIKKGKIQYAIDLIDAFADSCQRINNILRDDEIELTLEQIANKYIKQEPIESSIEKHTVVLYDQIGTTICLGLQYLRALIAKGYEIVYIYESPIHPISNLFLEEIKQVCKYYYIFSSRKLIKNGEYLGNEIRRIIRRHQPSSIIMHQEATGALAMTVLYSLKGIPRYKIIPGDHHFYLGYGCFDYFLDFRPFGWSTSFYERRIPIDQIINNTYYPIINDEQKFEGFPFETEGKLVILSGGATYKFEGSNDFYELLKYILSFDNVIFVFMGTPTAQLQAMKKDSNYDKKIYFLGYRRDFSQVIKRIDILFNSYPVSGGLFCQTAAYYSKPILAFSSKTLFLENNVEDILGFPNNGGIITFVDKGRFKEHAQRLIVDKIFRSEKGVECNSMLVNKEYFDNRLESILNKECEHIPRNVQYIDRSYRISVYLYNNNNFEPSVFLFPSKVLGIKFFYIMRFLGKDLLKHFKYIFVHAFSNNKLLRKILKKDRI